MKVLFKNFNMKIKGLKLFGLIITTKKAINNAKYSADDLIINPTKKQLIKVENE